MHLVLNNHTFFITSQVVKFNSLTSCKVFPHANHEFMSEEAEESNQEAGESAERAGPTVRNWKLRKPNSGDPLLRTRELTVELEAGKPEEEVVLAFWISEPG